MQPVNLGTWEEPFRATLYLAVARGAPLVEDADAPAYAHVEHDEDCHGGETRRRQRVKLDGESRRFLSIGMQINCDCF